MSGCGGWEFVSVIVVCLVGDLCCLVAGGLGDCSVVVGGQGRVLVIG